MNKENYFKLFEKLKQAGWYEERCIESTTESSLAQEYFPEKVLSFFRAFGDLKLESDLLQVHCDEDGSQIKLKIYGTSILSSLNENCLTTEDDRYHINLPINFSEDAQDYYYSSLIGTNLYAVATIHKSSLGIYMDEFGNFYEINEITELHWIANNPIDALEQLLYGATSSLILNEHTLKWMGRSNEQLIYEPPINKNLTENPW